MVDREGHSVEHQRVSVPDPRLTALVTLGTLVTSHAHSADEPSCPCWGPRTVSPVCPAALQPVGVSLTTASPPHQPYLRPPRPAAPHPENHTGRRLALFVRRGSWPSRAQVPWGYNVSRALPSRLPFYVKRSRTDPQAE